MVSISAAAEWQDVLDHLSSLQSAETGIQKADIQKIDNAVYRLRDAEDLPIEIQTIVRDCLFAMPSLLTIPPYFMLEEWDQTPETVRQSVLWRASAASLVQFSSIITKSIHLASQEVPLRVFVAFARFCGQQDDLWIDFNTAKVARETLENLLKHCGKEGVEHAILSILKGYVRSCFSRSPHPSVSRTSGRKLPRPAGSLSANSEEGAWKGKNGFEDAIGCWNVLAFCLDVMTPSQLENNWHLIIPPLMTLMDDHEVAFRIKGLSVARILLEQIDISLLRRTSLDQLIQASLSTSISFTSEVSYAPLVRQTIALNLYLIDKMYPPPKLLSDISLARFDALSRLIKEGPLHIYLYTGEKIVFAEIAADTIIQVADRLGLGMMRHMQDLLHPLLATLVFPRPPSGNKAIRYYAKVCQAITVLAKVCAPVMARWRGRILSSVLQCWTLIGEKVIFQEAAEILEPEFRAILNAVYSACGDDFLADLYTVEKLQDAHLSKLYAHLLTTPKVNELNSNNAHGKGEQAHANHS